MEFCDYLEIWISGIESEINFWNDFIANEGGEYFHSFKRTISPNRRFELEDDIPREFWGREYKFIDVGSGPFSRCGLITNKVDLDATAIDPLAYSYNIMKREYHIDNGVKLESGFVELLNKKYQPNSFDMVHMSNSLDHCFSAVDGLYQLLNICKIGGKIILRHAENEAEREGYAGLHQWNLSLDNEEQSFVIWRKEQRLDICEIFKEYADFELIKNVKENGGSWIYNKVVMVKKKNVSIPNNNYYNCMMDVFYHKLMDVITSNITNKEKKNTIISDRLDKIKYIYYHAEDCGKIMNKLSIGSVSIYGMGGIGKNLDYVISNCGIRIEDRIDSKGEESGCYEAKTMEEVMKISSDAIVLSIDNESVYKALCDKYKNTPVYRIDEFLNLF